MTSEDIIRMAREAGLTEVVRQHDDGTVTLEVPHLPRVLMFAALVAGAEREACALEADYEAARWSYAPEAREPCEEIAKAIRARSRA